MCIEVTVGVKWVTVYIKLQITVKINKFLKVATNLIENI